MFKKFSFQVKLLLLCGALSLISVIGGAIAYRNLENVSYQYEHVSNINLPKTRTLGEMLASFRRIRILLRTLGLPGISATETTQTIADVKAEIEIFEKLDERFRAVPFVDGEKPLYDAVRAEWDRFKKTGGEVLALQAEGSEQSRRKMSEIFFGSCPESAKAMNTAQKALMDFHGAQAEQWVSSANAVAQRASFTNLALTLGGMVVSLFVGVIFSRSLSRTIRDVVQGLSLGAGEVTSATSQISEASQNLSSSSTEQAAALQETVSSLEEVSSMIAKNADNAVRSQSVSETSNQTALKGREAVNEMITSIADISESNTEIMAQIESSNQEISSIVKVINEIGAKTKVINDIVFQTKLLSFNASVEAARAGEHGKGFAVVAEEVGNLAQMSGNAAKEISGMLEDSVQKVESIVRGTQTKVEGLVRSGREKVENGTQTAKRCGEVLTEIVTNVSELNRLVGEIAAASKEQAQGVQEINKAMTQLDQTTQANTATSQQTASAAVQLSSQADSLRGMVVSLQSIVEGEGKGNAVGERVAPVPARTPERASPAPVVQLRPRAEASSSPAPLKLAAGAESAPAADDPRFTDV